MTQYSRSPLQFSPAIIDACLRYFWPGNLRELENFVKRYLVMGDEAMALSELRNSATHTQVPVGAPAVTTNLQLEIIRTDGEAHPPQLKSVLRTLKDETELHAITRALEETHWNRKRAARLLKISYRGLLYKIRQHGITRTTLDVTPSHSRD